ncbi:hypothetical protein BWD162_012930 [Bartonella sp. WD16.2]|nr:hypothetical protein BWD162_012930 [Bartonella sp. WD16.2]
MPVGCLLEGEDGRGLIVTVGDNWGIDMRKGLGRFGDCSGRKGWELGGALGRALFERIF